MLKRERIAANVIVCRSLKKPQQLSMKKLIICVLCFATAHSYAQLRVGLQGSASSLNFWQSDGLGGVPTGLQTWAMNGYQAGVVVEYDLGYSGLTIQPAVLYAENGSHTGNTIGFIDDANSTIGYSNTSLKVYSVRVPINLIYKFDLNSKVKIFGGLGPYIAKNVSGTEKGYYTGDSIVNGNFIPYKRTINNKAKINNNTSQGTEGITNFTPFDFGGDILLGAEYKRFEFSINYSRGFSRVYHTTYANAGNTFWNLSVAYMIFGHYRKPKL
jgi:hypothetical protein